MKNKRKQYTCEKKAIILTRHLVERDALSDLCDETDCYPILLTHG